MLKRGRFPRLRISSRSLYDFSLYASVRKVLAVLVVAFLTSAAIPSFTSAQYGPVIEQRFHSLEGQISKLEKVPEDIAIIKVEIQSLQTGQKEQSDSIRYVIVSLICAAAIKLLEVFGLKVQKRERA